MEHSTSARSLIHNRKPEYSKTLKLPEQTLISSPSNLDNFAQSDGIGQMQSDSQPTYGPADTEFVRHQTYGNSETMVSIKIRSFIAVSTYVRVSETVVTS